KSSPMPEKCVHHVPKHPFTMSAIYTPAPARGAGVSLSASSSAPAPSTGAGWGGGELQDSVIRACGSVHRVPGPLPRWTRDVDPAETGPPPHRQAPAMAPDTAPQPPTTSHIALARKTPGMGLLDCIDQPDMKRLRAYRLGRLRAELRSRDYAGCLLY